MRDTTRPLEVGARVSVRGGVPATLGCPIAQVLAVGPVNAKVRLYYDGAEYRVPHNLLHMIAGPPPGEPWPAFPGNDTFDAATMLVVVDDIVHQEELLEAAT